MQKYLLGTDMTLFTTEHIDGNPPVQPYPTVTSTEPDDTYQSPPFTENLDPTGQTYQVPIYWNAAEQESMCDVIGLSVWMTGTAVQTEVVW